MQQPVWLVHAWADLGQREIAGSSDNPRIVGYYKQVGYDEINADEVAWCAAFVGACLERAGITSTRLLLARSYLTFGEGINEGRLGAIAVLSRGSDPALGHVGFLIGETDDHVFLLGGNQGDAVSVERFDKGRLLGLRWPVQLAPHSRRRVGEGGTLAPSTAPGSPPPPPPPRKGEGRRDGGFDAALAHVLEMEGGWSDDPHDPGGPTNKGITLATFAAWKGETPSTSRSAHLVAELKAISDESVRAIYRQRYWNPSRAAELPAGLALMHFDAAVNHGIGGAARMLQQALSVGVDGEIGPQTLAAAQARDTRKMIARYAGIRRERYRELPHFWRFGRGWLRRVDTTETRALAAAGAGPISTSKGSETMSDGMTADEIARTTANSNEVAPREHAEPKWWGESMTIWGVAITTLSTVLPVVGPFIGLDISAEMIRQIGAEAAKVIQAIGGLAGTLLTVYGRMRATAPLARREMRVRL